MMDMNRFVEILKDEYPENGILLIEAIRKIQKDKAELIELLELSTDELKLCADDNGKCYGCKNLDFITDECIIESGPELCDCKTNNMWQWKHQHRRDKILGVTNEPIPLTIEEMDNMIDNSVWIVSTGNGNVSRYHGKELPCCIILDKTALQHMKTPSEFTVLGRKISCIFGLDYKCYKTKPKAII